VHAGFFTPSRKGRIWDTWAYFHEGRYMYLKRIPCHGQLGFISGGDAVGFKNITVWQSN
jgi:hypothetical protein